MATWAHPQNIIVIIIQTLSLPHIYNDKQNVAIRIVQKCSKKFNSLQRQLVLFLLKCENTIVPYLASIKVFWQRGVHNHWVKYLLPIVKKNYLSPLFN